MSFDSVSAIFDKHVQSDGTISRALLLNALHRVTDLELDTLSAMLLCAENASSGAGQVAICDRVDYKVFLRWLWGHSSALRPPGQFPSAPEVAQQLFRRGFSVRQLIRFVKEHRVCGHRSLSDMTTADVVREIVIPETAAARCAMVDLFEGGPRVPQCLMSHWWGNSFTSLVEAIMAHASGQVMPSEKLCTKEQLEKTYWLCIFGVNQHVSICGTSWNPCTCKGEKFLNDHPLCEMTALSKGLHTEFCGTFNSGMSLVSLPSVEQASASREEDKRLILAEIEATIGIQGFNTSILEKVRAERAKFAIMDAVARRKTEVVDALLAEDPSLCNAQLRCFGSKSPLHFLAEKTRVASEWEDAERRTVILESLLRARSDCNLRDARGRTVLHAICQWDGSVGIAERLVEAKADVRAQVTGGSWAGKTPADILLANDTVKLEHVNRGLTDRSSSKKSELFRYLLQQSKVDELATRLAG